ncbi:MAG: hypothetical protein Kow00108_15020 [Calditrichia bacterium]
MLTIDEFIQEKADIVRDDSIHSARYFSEQLFQYLRELVSNKQFYHNRTELLQGLAKFSNAICKAKPLFGPLFNINRQLIEYIEDMPKHERNIDEIRKNVETYLSEKEQLFRSNIERINALGTKLIINHNTIFTLSYSSYVHDILVLARSQKKRFVVNILKSGPKNDGELLAESLLDKGIKVKLFPDSEFVRAIRESTFVLLGTDRIMENSFINKTGSHTAAIIAREFDIPLYLVADTLKLLLRRDYLVRYDEAPATEITNLEHEKLQVQNIYFEEVSLDYVSKVLLETGIFEKDEFVKRYLD